MHIRPKCLIITVFFPYPEKKEEEERKKPGQEPKIRKNERLQNPEPQLPSSINHCLPAGQGLTAAFCIQVAARL